MSQLLGICSDLLLPSCQPASCAWEETEASICAVRMEDSLALLVLPRGTERNRCDSNDSFFYASTTMKEVGWADL